MSIGLYRGAVAMHGQARQLDSIAQNLANVSSNGSKRLAVAMQTFTVQRASGPVEGQRTQQTVDFSQGNLVQTGREMDLALFGSGFFAVEGPDGEHYTRDGEFSVTPAGVLVNSDGWPVAWEDRTGLIDPTGPDIAVDSLGVVRQSTLTLGRLRVVDFQDPQKLLPDGKGNWQAPEGVQPATATAVVNQGALEEANTSAVEEMVAMIAVQRQYDTVARTLSSLMDSYERLTRPF